MSINEIQFLQAACFSADEDRVRNLLSHTDYNDYLASSDGYKLLGSMLKNSVFSPERREQLQVGSTAYQKYLSHFLAISKALLEHGVKVNDNRENLPSTPLHFAVQTNNKEIVEILLSKGADVNAMDHDGNTPLHLTVAINSEISRLLLDNGADVGICNSSGSSPFAFTGDQSIRKLLSFHKIKRFLDKGGNIEKKNFEDKTLLHKAVEDRNQQLVEFLLHRGCNVNAVTEFGETPLHLAAELLNNEIVLLLLQNGANVDATTTEGDTPLHYAAKSHFLGDGGDTLKSLLKNGANKSAQNCLGLIPLSYSVKDQLWISTAILLGDNPDLCDKNLKTAFCSSFLDYTSDDTAERSLLVSKLFVDLGFTISVQDLQDVNIPEELYPTVSDLSPHSRFTSILEKLFNKQEPFSAEQIKKEYLEYHVLLGAVKFGFTEIFHLLIPRVNVNAPLADGFTLLHHACKNGNLSIVDKLLSRGANVNATECIDKLSPLHLSVIKNFQDVSQILLKNGANIDACNNENETPLFFACQEKNIECLLLLLETGANVNSVSTCKDCALHYTVHHVNPKIVQILLHYGANVNADESFGITTIFKASKRRLQYGSISAESANLFFDYGAKVNDLHPEQFYNSRIFEKFKVKAFAAGIEDINFSPNDKEMVDFQAKCLEEIRQMKLMKLGESDVTIHDFLIMPHRRAAIYMRNKKIAEFMDSMNFETFPIFASKLSVCVTRGKLEKRLMELSSLCIEVVLKFQFPAVVMDQILSYCNTAELHRLIITSPIDWEMKKTVQYKYWNASLDL